MIRYSRISAFLCLVSFALACHKEIVPQAIYADQMPAPSGFTKYHTWAEVVGISQNYPYIREGLFDKSGKTDAGSALVYIPKEQLAKYFEKHNEIGLRDHEENELKRRVHKEVRTESDYYHLRHSYPSLKRSDEKTGILELSAKLAFKDTEVYVTADSSVFFAEKGSVTMEELLKNQWLCLSCLPK
jgi:hypothetical protein